MSQVRGIVVALFGALALCVVLAACGGGEEPAGEGDATTAITKEEYLQQADDICARINQELQPAFEQRDVEQAVSIMREGISDLRALPQPPGDEGQLDEIYTSAERGIDRFEQGPPQTGRSPFNEFTKLADSYGFAGGCTQNQGDA